jgi:hypothetical protein
MLAEPQAIPRAERKHAHLVDHVLDGFCAAIDRAFERGGAAIVAEADRERRAAKRRIKEGACLVDGRPTMAGWANHGDGEYTHASNSAIQVKRIGSNAKAISTNGRLTTTDLWGWRLAGQSPDWRGPFPTRAAAFDAAMNALDGGAR